MPTIHVEIEEIPHGHGLSFKKGVTDGLLETNTHEQSVHATHRASYQRGVAAGQQLREEIARVVKK
jgi:hypothetical protein